MTVILEEETLRVMCAENHAVFSKEISWTDKYIEQ